MASLDNRVGETLIELKSRGLRNEARRVKRRTVGTCFNQLGFIPRMYGVYNM
jgi:hypothetical protein